MLAGDSALPVALATLAAALAFRPLRDRLQHLVDRRFARARFEGVRLVRDLLDDVRDGRSEPEDVGAVLALALDDPGAEVLFRLPETGAYADRNGRVVEALPDDGRARSPIGRAGRELGVLLHDPALAQRPDLLHGLLDAAGVTVELARLRVELRLQLAEVESSRARIALAGYEERRRLERDLHDGAQQRLVTLGIVLRRLQRSLPSGARMLAPALDAAVDEVAGMISDLWTIAAARDRRADAGLAAALQDLARGATSRARRCRRIRGPRSPEVEAVAYFIACEAMPTRSSTGRRRAYPCAPRADGAPRLVVSDDGVGGAARARAPGWPASRTASLPRAGRWRSRARRAPAPARRGAAVRVVIAEGTAPLREGLAGLLEDAGHEVVGRAGDADVLLALVGEHAPDLAVVDVPLDCRRATTTRERGRRRRSAVASRGPPSWSFSQHIETRHIVELVTAGGGFGYLLKDRVLDVDDFLDAARRCHAAGRRSTLRSWQRSSPPRSATARSTSSPRASRRCSR